MNMRNMNSRLPSTKNRTQPSEDMAQPMPSPPLSGPACPAQPAIPAHSDQPAPQCTGGSIFCYLTSYSDMQHNFFPRVDPELLPPPSIITEIDTLLDRANEEQEQKVRDMPGECEGGEGRDRHCICNRLRAPDVESAEETTLGFSK